MSYTVELILNSLPQNSQKAWGEIERLREAYYEDGQKPHNSYREFLKSIQTSYPCLCSYADNDPSVEESPWADGPLINNFNHTMGMLAIVFSKVNEVLPFIIETAKRFNITVADAQTGEIYRNGIEPLPNSK